MHGLEIKTLSIEALAALRDDVVVLWPRRSAGAKAKAKYRKGADEWSGSGYKPYWVADHLAAGGTLDKLKVA